ncbi:serine/threonine protein kinase, partial [Micromonospora sp. U21]|nr:serine/threonine protein kinase [Micromonospora sp. U21]
PTLIDRSAAHPHPAPVGAAPRQRRLRRPLAVLTATGLAALIGLGALLAQGLNSPDSPGSAQASNPPSSATPVPSPTTQSPTPAAPSSPPGSSVPWTVGQQMPISLRAVSAEFAAVLAQAQARGEIDRKTAEDLRDDLVDLNRRSKDRDRRIADLRERIDELVDRERLPARTGAQLDSLLTQARALSTGRSDD